MNENERIVCEFLRKIAPPREWEYLGEVEHYLIGELCDELNKQLNAENAKLKEERDGFKALSELKDAQFNNVLGSFKMLKLENAKLRELCADIYEMAYYEYPSAFEAVFSGRMRELGILRWTGERARNKVCG